MTSDKGSKERIAALGLMLRNLEKWFKEKKSSEAQSLQEHGLTTVPGKVFISKMDIQERVLKKSFASPFPSKTIYL